jgi:hypothetical protein
MNVWGAIHPPAKRGIEITDPDVRSVAFPRESTCEEIILMDNTFEMIPGAAWREDDQTITIDPRASLDQYPLHLAVYDI